MASHWPVIVGINQYQFLQPLLFAQFDALELKDFLVGEAGLPPQQCALLTDISPMVYQGAAFPTREVILQRLQQTCERARADDTVWFFFSGYGVHWEGQDYLLPIDGDPRQVVQTGIAMQAIFALFQNSPARQGLIILDINRSQSALPNQRLGVPTMEWAKHLEIPLLLSCRPNQFSQETLAVRHGLFTEAILEGLRFHGCLTLSQLSAYLNDRVPELCQHHFRPTQNPVSVIPTQYQFLMLVPAGAVGQMPMAEGPAAVASASLIAGETAQPKATVGVPFNLREANLPRGPVQASAMPQPVGNQSGATETELVDAADLNEAVGQQEPQPEQTGLEGWQRWAIVAAGMLLLGVLLRNQATFLGTRQSDDERNTPVESVESDTVLPAPETVPTDTEVAVPPPESQVAGEPEAEPLFPGQEGNGALDPQAALEQARIAIDQRRYGEALNWLEQIPVEQRSEDFTALQEQAQAGYDSAALSGEAVLNSARQIIEPLPASSFNDAIEAARQVPVGDASYDQAQADIARWSLVILDLAQGRAATGNFDAAIAAANLVPQDQGEIYAQAQALIQQWQQQQVNRQILQEAQAQLQPDQATSFEAAIQLAQQVPPGSPEYEIAKERIDQWSEDILVIARARAADGQLPGAISAAALVPPGTSAYDKALEEIQRWQSQ